MFSIKTRKILVIALAIGWIATGIYFIERSKKGFCPFIAKSTEKNLTCALPAATFKEASELLRTRKDKEAMALFEQILAVEPDNIDALCGKAEILRRSRSYKDSQELLNKILSRNPDYIPASLSLAYTIFQENKLDEALKIVNQILKKGCVDKDDEGLAYMLLGAINSQRAQKGWFFTKLKYGTKIQCYFLKAKELAPEQPEVRAGLGSFYLLAPPIVGGDINKAIPELEYAVKIAPDFATANARLAQAYKKKGNISKYNIYINRAKELDPGNEVFKEIK